MKFILYIYILYFYWLIENVMFGMNKKWENKMIIKEKIENCVYLYVIFVFYSIKFSI